MPGFARFHRQTIPEFMAAEDGFLYKTSCAIPRSQHNACSCCGGFGKLKNQTGSPKTVRIYQSSTDWRFQLPINNICQSPIQASSCKEIRIGKWVGFGCYRQLRSSQISRERLFSAPTKSDTIWNGFDSWSMVFHFKYRNWSETGGGSYWFFVYPRIFGRHWLSQQEQFRAPQGCVEVYVEEEEEPIHFVCVRTLIWWTWGHYRGRTPPHPHELSIVIGWGWSNSCSSFSHPSSSALLRHCAWCQG